MDPPFFASLHDARPIRKRMVRTAAHGEVRFLTFSCERRLPLLSHPGISRLFADRLGAARKRWSFRLLGWVVMPEHVHLLLIPPGPDHADHDLTDRILEFIKKSVAQRAIAHWKRTDASILRDIARHADGVPRFWLKGGGFDRCCRDWEEMTRALRYLHRNPVERGLCASPTDWAWSSARCWSRYTGQGGSSPLVECDPPPGPSWTTWNGWK